MIIKSLKLVKRSWLLVALANLVVIAFLGLLLRWLFVSPIEGVDYKNLLHAHSHVALLGWIYTALFVALLYTFLPEKMLQKKTYRAQFWLSQGAVLGMLVSFPVQGYALYSITFSTAHILLGYWFIYQFLKDAKAANISAGPHRLSFQFIKAGLFFLALSTLGPWSLGPIMATGHSGSNLYYNAIYFYLHFQYNGWFAFAVFGLLFRLLEHYQVNFNYRGAELFFRLMFWACLPSFLLSVLWAKPCAVIYILGGAAALVQLLAFVLLARLLYPVRGEIYKLFSGWSRRLLLCSASAFALKTLMQTTTGFPYIADLAYRLRFFIIGYLHLVLIGFISLFLVSFFAQQKWLSFKLSSSRWGMGIFILAFVASETLLFLQGFLYWIQFGTIPYFNQLLFGVSVFLPLGILLFFLAQVSERKHIKQEEKPLVQLKQV
jgi:hypothetical protein